MVDEWLGRELGVHWLVPAEVAWAPVETVSLSELDFERMYQGSAMLLSWPVRLAPAGRGPCGCTQPSADRGGCRDVAGGAGRDPGFHLRAPASAC